jgi:hypothetical protein
MLLKNAGTAYNGKNKIILFMKMNEDFTVDDFRVVFNSACFDQIFT